MSASPSDRCPNATSPAGDPDEVGREFVQKCEIQMSHAWMVRTFVKHSEEAEDAPELMALPRVIFDLAMALESRTGDPPAYHKMLSKKLGKLRKAAVQFAAEAPAVSTHTNFQMAAASVAAVVDELARLHAAYSPPRPVSPS